MKKALLIALMSFFFVGCESFKKLTDAEATPPAPYKTSVQGILQGERECVSVDGMNPDAPFNVFVNDVLISKLDYNYHHDAHRVCFRSHVTVLPDGTYMLSGPVSHAGDNYRIETQ